LHPIHRPIFIYRKWTKGRGTVVSFNPKVGSIDGMHVDFEEYMMIAASKQDGIAAKCNPTTGKIDRHYLYCTNESIRTMVTAVKVDKNRILWGFGQGFITLSIRTKSSGASSNRLKVFSEFHHGPVRIVELPSFNQEVVVSGSDDGTVKIWDVTSATCAHTLHGSSGAVPTSLKVSVDQYILAGYDNGYIAVWNIHLGHIIKGHRRRQYLTQEELDKKKILVPPPTKERGASVTDIIYDPDSGTFIASYSGLTSVYKYNVSTGERVAVFEGGHDLANSITCIQWDRSSLSSALSLESAVKPNPLKKKGGIIDLSSSRSSSGTSTPVVNQLPVKTTRLLVTGDNTGSLCLWNSDDMTQDGSIIKPLCVLNGHIYAISAIYIDACKIVTGSDDGWIYVWDPLTGTILHTLGNKIPKNAPVDRTDVQVMRVKNLICNDYQGVATIGHQVKSWDFSPGKQFSSKYNLCFMLHHF
jgi:WD40 repeat protein